MARNKIPCELQDIAAQHKHSDIDPKAKQQLLDQLYLEQRQVRGVYRRRPKPKSEAPSTPMQVRDLLR
ncbi:hypothetical protein JW859_07095 [bacterium]|nr:hypothetical protein [bacterium]